MKALSSRTKKIKTFRCRPCADTAAPARRPLSAAVIALCCAGLSLAGCSGSSSGSSVGSAGVATTGDITVTARTTTGSSALSVDTASANTLTVTVDSADISTDGSTYESLVAGPISTNLGQNTNPLLSARTSLPVGEYNAVRVTVSSVAWSADWVTTNPSPCTGATSGHAEGSETPANKLTLYFATPNLGGNTRAYYRANPPLNGYIGDDTHPLIMPAPIAVLQNQTTTVNLVFDTDHLLSCNRVNLFTTSDTGDAKPQHSLSGEATSLFTSYGLFQDTRRGLIGATNSGNDSINFYKTGDASDTAPTRVIAGPLSALNAPKGATFYRDAGDTSGNSDEIIVANSGNDSIGIFSSTSTGNVAPQRLITGFNRTRLNQPTGIALHLIPGSPQLDEVWVTNKGNNTVTAYNRQDSGDADPIFPKAQPSPTLPSIGSAQAGADQTGLDNPCGIDVADVNGKTYVFVTNAGKTDSSGPAGDGSITVYDYTQVTQSTDGNVAPLLTMTGSGSGLIRPCGIHVDTTDNRIYVTNTGKYSNNYLGSSVAAYTWTLDGSGTINGLTLDQNHTLLPGPNGDIKAPTAILVQSGGSLWVADRGTQPAMTRLPDVYPSSSSGQAADAALKGKYNVILYGVDLGKGINGQGYLIPTLFAERGVASFDPTASPWPAFNLRVDTENRRTVIDRGCTQEDVGGLPKQGFYGVGNDGSFYAFNEGDHGSVRGAYVPDGRAFAGSFYNNSKKLFVMYGVKDTGLTTTYLGADGTQTGGVAPYAYTAYANRIIQIKRFESPPKADLFQYRLIVGAAAASHTQFDAVSVDANLNTLTNPMGDFAAPATAGVTYRTSFLNLNSSIYSPQAGGRFDDQDRTYGMAGAIASDGSSMLFMDNTSDVDSDNCPATAGMGLGLRQNATKTFTNSDLKGTYFVAGFGDQFQSVSLPDLYLTEAGTLTFDGNNSVTMSFDMNNQGKIAVDNGTLSYQVSKRNLPAGLNVAVSAPVQVVDLFGSDKTIPFATAIIGEDGKMLSFYRNLVQPNTGPPATADPVRFLGLALFQHP